MKLKIITCCILIIFSGVSAGAAEKLKVNDQIIRLHIVADNISPEAEQAKLAVRDEIADWLHQQQISKLSTTAAVRYLANRLGRIKYLSQNALIGSGVAQPIAVALGATNLPAKMYQETDFALPAGKYLTLNIIIGEGEGQNWWCIAYPDQCLTKNTISQVNNQDQIELKLKFVEWLKQNRKKYSNIYQDTLMF